MFEIRIKLRAASKIRERWIRVRLMAVRDITAKSIDTGEIIDGNEVSFVSNKML